MSNARETELPHIRYLADHPCKWNFGMHATFTGPVKDLKRARAHKHGSLRAEGLSLLFKSNGGEQVQLTLDCSLGVIDLAFQLLAQVPEKLRNPRTREFRDRIRAWAAEK